MDLFGPNSAVLKNILPKSYLSPTLACLVRGGFSAAAGATIHFVHARESRCVIWPFLCVTMIVAPVATKKGTVRGGRDLVRSEPVDRRDGVSPKSPARFRVQGRGRRRVDVHINSVAQFGQE